MSPHSTGPDNESSYHAGSLGSTVLDVERFDGAAGRAMSGRTVDLIDVQRRVSARRRRDRAKAATWAVLAAAAALLVGVLTPAGGRLISNPQPPIPASKLSGPGALPSVVYPVPPWIPSLNDAPMARAALVVAADIGIGSWGGSSSATSAVLVSADGPQYAALPTRTASAVSLSRDGTKVAWTPAGFADHATTPAEVWYMATAGGQEHQVDVSDGNPTSIGATTWSADGRWIAVNLTWRRTGSTSGEAAVSVIDTRSGTAYRVCACYGSAGFGDGELLVGGLPEPGVVLTPPPGLPIGHMPAGAGASGNVMITQPQPQLSDYGKSYLTLSKRDDSSYGPPDDFFVVRKGPVGDAKVAMSPSFGKLTSVSLLAWDGANSVWLTASSPACAVCTYRFSLADGSMTKVVETRSDDPDHPIRDIAVAAHDVAMGGQFSSATPPTWPWYQPDRIRWGIGAWRYLLISLLIMVAIGRIIIIRGRSTVRARQAELHERARLATELGSPD